MDTEKEEEGGGGANWWLQIRLAESASAAAFPTRCFLSLVPPQCPKRIMATVKGNPLAGRAAKCVAGQTDTAATQRGRQRGGERERDSGKEVSGDTAFYAIATGTSLAPPSAAAGCVEYIFTHCSCISTLLHQWCLSSIIQVFCHCQHSVMA